MQFYKTDKARAELKPGVRRLSQRERTLLLLADGNKTLADFSAMFDGDGLRVVQSLQANGYLQTTSQNPAAFRKADTQPAPLDSRFFDSRPALPVLGLPAQAAAKTVQSPQNAADNFEGKRSLATTRMFLFDICERMFARRNPEAADMFREALRNAKDRETMLSVSRDMIDMIEEVAGHERADSISERIAMLLPSEQVT